MKFFYTNSRCFNDTQPKPLLSLGGFISSTPIPNSLVGNLFGDISSFKIDKKDEFDTIGIVLLNDEGVNVTDILLHFDFETDAFTKIEVAAPIQIDDDGDGNLSMEKIVNSHSLPFIGNFVEANGVINQINIGNLLAGEFLGLWLKRTLLPNIKDNFTSENLDTNFGTPPVTQENVKLQLNWTAP